MFALATVVNVVVVLISRSRSLPNHRAAYLSYPLLSLRLLVLVAITAAGAATVRTAALLPPLLLSVLLLASFLGSLFLHFLLMLLRIEDMDKRTVLHTATGANPHAGPTG